MKNAPTPNSSESAPDKRDYNAGTFPVRHDTVLADVLACPPIQSVGEDRP
jgi:hypothetical protein